MQDGKLSFKDALMLLKRFQPECRQIKSREDLIRFIDKHAGLYWELNGLKDQLKNSNYKF